MKPKINVEKIVLEVLGEKELKIEKKKNRIKIWYKAPHVTNLKQIILPSKIELDKDFGEGIGLYCGDGDLNSQSQRHVTFSTVDEDVGRFMFIFFKKYFNLTSKNLKLQVYSSNKNRSISLYKWSKTLKVPSSRFTTSVSGINKKGCLQIHISSIIFGKIFRKIVKCSLENVLKYSKLRKAFLRGYFAADGSIEIRKNKSYIQISHISFAYHKTKETWLRNFAIKCLKKRRNQKYQNKIIQKQTECSNKSW